jgi:hypothetical protein
MKVVFFPDSAARHAWTTVDENFILYILVCVLNWFITCFILVFKHFSPESATVALIND